MAPPLRLVSVCDEVALFVYSKNSKKLCLLRPSWWGLLIKDLSMEVAQRMAVLLTQSYQIACVVKVLSASF